MVILAVKPQIMGAVLKEIAGAVDRARLLISVAAGVPVARLREGLGKDARLIRVMPNTPALVLEGVTAIARADGLEAGDLELAQELFGAVGPRGGARRGRPRRGDRALAAPAPPTWPSSSSRSPTAASRWGSTAPPP